MTVTMTEKQDAKSILQLSLVCVERQHSCKGFMLHKARVEFSIKQFAVNLTYRKVAGSSLTQLVAHPSIFRLSMKWIFVAYVL